MVQVMTTQVAVPVDQEWTDTGVQCQQGDSVHIVASGTAYHASGEDSAVDPNGLTDPSFHKYNVEGLPDDNTASLIGSLDGEQPFFVGTDQTRTCDRDGQLLLGMNDTNLGTNHGQWSATVTLSRPS